VSKVYHEISFKPGATSINAVVLPPNQRQVRGLNLKRSKRWSDAFPRMGGGYELPLIDRLGRFTGSSVYTLACEPADVLSTTVATVFSRLKRYAFAHNSAREVARLLRVILKAAAYYTLSKNSYYMDRLLYLLRTISRNGNRIHPLTLKFMTKMDADKRFVYSQVCHQTNWLIFRACRPRDKSIQSKSKHATPLPRDKGRLLNGYVRSIITGICESPAMIGRPNGVLSLRT